jgi:hypothetical protein
VVRNIRIIVIWFLIAMLIAVFACATNVFASSTHPAPGGEGVNSISGYVVTDIEYHLASDVSQVDGVEFSLDRPAAFVEVSLVSSDPVFYSCRNTGANHWSCTAPDVDITSLDHLQIIAIGN